MELITHAGKYIDCNMPKERTQSDILQSHVLLLLVEPPVEMLVIDKPAPMTTNNHNKQQSILLTVKLTTRNHLG
jgi:hypothetical protein